MLNVCVLTGTRADYGLLYLTLKELKSDKLIKLHLLATGTHLSKKHGHTYKEIEGDGFKIDSKINILSSKDDSKDISNITAKAIKGFSNYFSKNKIDLMIILGDRYEALAAAVSSTFHKIPILHIHGGEITEGAYDDMIRHAITKMSNYHVATTDIHKKRIVQMGENPKNVKNFGAPGLEFIKKIKLLDKSNLSKKLGIELEKFFVVTFHPETLSPIPPKKQIKILLRALSNFNNYKLLFSYSNADEGGNSIIKEIEAFKKLHSDQVFIVPSMGQLIYLSAVANSNLVVGNSSSAIIEAPSLKKISVNIGERQKGRISADSVIHSSLNEKKIILSIKKGLSKSFTQNHNIYSNPYDSASTSKRIVKWIKDINIQKHKSFFDFKN